MRKRVFSFSRLAIVLGRVCLLALLATSAVGKASESKQSRGGSELSRLSMLPAKISLSRPQASHRLLIQAHFADGRQEDWTAQAHFSSSSPKIATVDESGTVRAVSDGEAVITATVKSQRVQAEVEIRNATAPFVWSFKNHVIPVMTKAGCNSGPCHGAAAGKNGFKLTLRGYDPETDYHVLTRQAVGRRIVKLDPARSLVLLKPTLAIPHGGGRRFGVESTSYEIMSEWIAAGTPPPSPADPKVESLELLPKQAVLKPGAEQQLLVRAHFSDGHVEDVTPWARYDSTDLGVATVDDSGQVKMQGHGEAAINVGYMSLVSITRFSVPFPHPVSDQLFQQAPRNNYIDELVLNKLRRLRIPPSGLCTDSEFIRRAYLDAAGILPTAAEAEEFLKDKSADKRKKLIDALLERPEFVDYWAYKWSDVLLLKTPGKGANPDARNLGKGALWSYYSWIRSGVAANKSWDQFVREMLVSSGSNTENGAVNYLVTHLDPLEASENVGKAFLGLSIACAKCHNHPFEKWTQNDYYAMANLFARIGRKNGDRLGEMVVFSKPEGEVNHPRLGRPLRPKTLTGGPLEFNSPIDRRVHLANWLTSPENPFFARTLVNRVWGNFMGRGLVDPVDDMRETNLASNEGLLSALAKDFVERGFDVRYLIRTIMNSATYQLSSKTNKLNAQDEKYSSHYLTRRLQAEVMLDAISQVTGVPEKFPGFPVGTRALQLPDANVDSYFLTTFGRNPRIITDETERETSPNLSQVLHIANGKTINRKLMAPGSSVDMMVKLGLSNERKLNHLYLSAFSRYPTDDERTELLDTMEEGEQQAQEDGRRRVLEDLLWAMLTSKEFLFNH